VKDFFKKFCSQKLCLEVGTGRSYPTGVLSTHEC